MQEREQKERDGYRGDVHSRRRRTQADRAEELVEKMGKHRLADPAEGKGSDRNPELRCGDVAI